MRKTGGRTPRGEKQSILRDEDGRKIIIGLAILGSEAVAAAVHALSIQSTITSDEDSRAFLRNYRSRLRAPSPCTDLF